MKRILGLHVLLLVFVIQAAIKCQAKFCSDRQKNLQQELNEHYVRCIFPAVKSECCVAEKSSLDERKKNHGILCGGKYKFEYRRSIIHVSLYFLSKFGNAVH